MALTNAFTPRALIHSTASAARITRFPMEFVLGDLCDKKSVDSAMQGCDAVVHLARGDNPVMREGLENVLRAAAGHGVSRFVHLSSVAVFGNDPLPESATEDSPAKRTDNAYGNEKLAQEHRVLRWGRRASLPVVILRPPFVWGPSSYFTIDLINRIRSSNLALVDEGLNPCNLVYVDNLVEAILLAIWKPEAAMQTFFVTDSDGVSWGQCLEGHAALLNRSLPHIRQADLVDPPKESYLGESIRALPRVLLSGELRKLLKQVPMIRSIESVFYAGFQSLSRDTQENLRLRISGPTVIRKKDSRLNKVFSRDNIHSAQSRKVAHSNERARRLLGYTAPISYAEGMTLTEAWLRYARVI